MARSFKFFLWKLGVCENIYSRSRRSKSLESNQSGKHGKIGLGGKMLATGSKGSCRLPPRVSESPAVRTRPQKGFLRIEPDPSHFALLLIDVEGALARVLIRGKGRSSGTCARMLDD